MSKLWSFEQHSVTESIQNSLTIKIILDLFLNKILWARRDIVREGVDVSIANWKNAISEDQMKTKIGLQSQTAVKNVAGQKAKGLAPKFRGIVEDAIKGTGKK